MLRLIDIQIEKMGVGDIRVDKYGQIHYLRAMNFPKFYIDIVCGRVVDVDKMKELCKLRFYADSDFGAVLLASKGEERTRLTTIDGELEQLIRERYDK